MGGVANRVTLGNAPANRRLFGAVATGMATGLAALTLQIGVEERPRLGLIARHQVA